jgi:hypothetical protein
VKVVYVAGPYRADSEWEVLQNIRQAEEVAKELWLAGAAVICPHKNTAFFGGLAPDDVWLNGDLEILSRCDIVVMGWNWQRSSGAHAERNRALDIGIPVYHWGDFDERVMLLERLRAYRAKCSLPSPSASGRVVPRSEPQPQGTQGRPEGRS